MVVHPRRHVLYKKMISLKVLKMYRKVLKVCRRNNLSLIHKPNISKDKRMMNVMMVRVQHSIGGHLCYTDMF